MAGVADLIKGMSGSSKLMAGLSVAQLALGAGQMIGQGIQRRKAEREFDQYQVPGSMYDLLEQARIQAAGKGLPEEDLYRSQAQASTARSVEALQRTAESPGDVLAGVTGLDRNYKGFETNMAIASAQERRKNQGVYMDTLEKLAGYESQKWMYNEYLPYAQRMTGASQLGESGAMNIGSGAASMLHLANQESQLQLSRDDLEKFKLQMGIGDKQNSTYSSTGGYVPSAPKQYNLF
jgi:hypothetical protein